MSVPDDRLAHGADPVSDALDRAGALAEVGRDEEAEALLRRALADEPEDAALHAALAQVLLRRGEHGPALEHAERTVALAPEVGFGHALRSMVLSTDLRRRREAVDAAREAVRLDPEESYGHLTLARACLRSRWFPEALDAADRAVGLDPEDADGHGLRGAALMGLGRPADAEQAMREALRLQPGDGDALHDLGVAVSVQGRDRQDEARGLFVDAARADPTDRHARASMVSASRKAVYGTWGWPLVGFAVLRALIYLFGDDAAARGPGTAAWLVVAAAVATFLLVRGRLRRRKLSDPERRALRESRWTGRIRAPRTMPTRRRGRRR